MHVVSLVGRRARQAHLSTACHDPESPAALQSANCRLPIVLECHECRSGLLRSPAPIIPGLPSLAATPETFALARDFLCALHLTLPHTSLGGRRRVFDRLATSHRATLH